MAKTIVSKTITPLVSLKTRAFLRERMDQSIIRHFKAHCIAQPVF